jgi:hypothetical protein
MKKVLFHVIVWMNCFISCTEDLTPPAATNQVRITMDPLTTITNTSVRFDATVVADGGNAITQRGIVVGTSSNPTVNNQKKIMGAGLGRFSDTIAGLNTNTVYYLRPYATNSLGTVYGDQVSFRTLLNTPALSNPANGAQESCCTVFFQWTSVFGATQYEIEIARNTLFNGSVYAITICTGTTTLQYSSVNKATVNPTSFCVRAGTAINNGTWYWRVRARNTTTLSGWSSVRTFNYVY